MALCTIIFNIVILIDNVMMLIENSKYIQLRYELTSMAFIANALIFKQFVQITGEHILLSITFVNNRII